MANDFRTYLEEANRHEKFGRFFKEISLGLKIAVSIQASEAHECEPAETLDDVNAYDSWYVVLRQTNKPIDLPKLGVWENFWELPWAQGFEKPEYGKFVGRGFMPTAEVQQMFDDLVAFAVEKGQLESQEHVVTLNPDEPIKKVGKRGGCGSCGKK